MKKIAGGLVILFLVGIIAWLIKPETTEKPVLSATESFLAQSQSFGGVEVSVEPKQLKRGEKMVFEVSFNTHSVELNYDWGEIFRVSDGQGRVYWLEEWTGGEGGHHLAGELVFEKLQIDEGLIRMEIAGIDGNSGQFIWQKGGEKQ